MNPEDRIARALNALDDLPSTARRALMVSVPLLSAGAFVAAFALAPSGHGGDAPAHRPVRQRPAGAPVVVAPHPLPAAAARNHSLSTATDRALRFLRGYLAYSYGRGHLRAIPAADPKLLAALDRAHPRVPPAARTRRPRITTLQVLPQAPGTAQATATITDGSGLQYPLVFYLDRRPSGWIVTRLADD
jgi:hypothetical protein